MRLNILDPKTLELTAILSNYESVQWSPSFNTPDGTFQINCSTDFIHLFEDGALIENTASLKHVGVVKRVETVVTSTKTSLQVSGVFLEKDIFSKRIIKAWIVYHDQYPTWILRNLIGLSITEPTENNRKLEQVGEIIIPADDEVADMEKIEYQAKYPNLVDEVFSLLQNMNLGVRAYINRDTMKIDIEFYTGNDYTFGSDEPVVFSPERGTIKSSQYAKDSSQKITHILLIGEANITVEAEKGVEEGEEIVEKSIDVSSDLPWPTYRVEKPNDSGGSYYRYKRYIPKEGYITNQDMWEKYEVERIETTTTLYRQEIGSPVEVTPSELKANKEMYTNAQLSLKNGIVGSSVANTSSLIASAVKNVKSGSNILVGYLSKKSNSASIASEEVQPLALMSSRASSSSGTSSGNTSIVKKSTASSKGSSKGLSAASTLQQVANTIVKVAATIKESGVTLTASPISMVPYTVTNVTYETGEFLEYVYVNIGEEPTDATKIVEGSFASGDVTYYENFEDVRVSEAQYRNSMLQKAKEYLKVFSLSETVEVEPYELSNLVYGQTYELGDIVTTRNHKLGYSIDERVTHSTEIWDSKGKKTEISFGNPVPSLTNRIKLISKKGI